MNFLQNSSENKKTTKQRSVQTNSDLAGMTQTANFTIADKAAGVNKIAAFCRKDEKGAEKTVKSAQSQPLASSAAWVLPCST